MTSFLLILTVLVLLLVAYENKSPKSTYNKWKEKKDVTK